MRNIDKYTIEVIGIPSIVLMENAKNALIKSLPLNDYNKYIITAGVGNNGGDALAMARDLILKEKDTYIYIVGDIEKASKDFLINFNILKNIKANIIELKDNKDLAKLEENLSADSIVIDGIFGTGLRKEVRGIFMETINTINASEAFKFSIDIPSGLDADTGDVHGSVINADYVVTLGLMKKGLENYEGQIKVESIGIPKIAVEAILNK